MNLVGLISIEVSADAAAAAGSELVRARTAATYPEDVINKDTPNLLDVKAYLLHIR